MSMSFKANRGLKDKLEVLQDKKNWKTKQESEFSKSFGEKIPGRPKVLSFHFRQKINPMSFGVETGNTLLLGP